MAAISASELVGLPEARIPLGEIVIEMALSPKSNSAYLAIGKALEEVKQSGNQPVPLHLRNSPTQLMKELGYGIDYKYAHDFPGHFVIQQYLPDALKNKQFWEPQSNPAEEKHKERMKVLWNKEKKF